MIAFKASRVRASPALRVVEPLPMSSQILNASYPSPIGGPSTIMPANSSGGRRIDAGVILAMVGRAVSRPWDPGPVSRVELRPAQIAGSMGTRRRALLARAAVCLALGVWTMHFVDMLAKRVPCPVG